MTTANYYVISALEKALQIAHAVYRGRSDDVNKLEIAEWTAKGGKQAYLHKSHGYMMRVIVVVEPLQKERADETSLW